MVGVLLDPYAHVRVPRMKNVELRILGADEDWQRRAVYEVLRLKAIRAQILGARVNDDTRSIDDDPADQPKE